MINIAIAQMCKSLRIKGNNFFRKLKQKMFSNDLFLKTKSFMFALSV